MTDLRQAAQQALEALEESVGMVDNLHCYGICMDAITALRTALEQQQAEPVACPIGLDKKGASQFCSAGYCATCKQQQAEPVAQLRPFDVLVITTAYEQGVGKGHQSHGRSVEIENPYAPGECQQAWALGYDEGKEQAASKAAHHIQEPKS